MAEKQSRCVICRNNLESSVLFIGDEIDLDCPTCGKYRCVVDLVRKLNGDSGETLTNDEELVARISHHLHLLRRGEIAVPQFTMGMIDRIRQDDYTPSLGEQIDNLILLIGKDSGHPGVRLQIIARDCYTCIGALLPETVGFLVVELTRRGLLEGEVSRALNPADFQAISALTIEGWNRYDDIVRHGGVGSRAFIAMPFGRADLEAHWLPIVRLAVKDVGFQLRRLDDQPRPGIIDVRMRQEIKDARFVIVELTHANHGAYWEAGYAEGLGKPVIYTCRKGETNIHFDAAHLQRIEWGSDDFELAAEQLKAMIRLSVKEARRE